MTPSTKMICPRCGAPMNRHAVKMIQFDTHVADSPLDPIGGGRAEPVYACARCGTNWSEGMTRT